MHEGNILQPEKTLEEQGVVPGASLLLVRKPVEADELDKVTRWLCGVRCAGDVRNLDEACRQNPSAIVEFLLDQGAEPNSEDFFGMTPLEIAAREGNLGLVRALLANTRTTVRWCAFEFAVYRNHADICKVIVQDARFPINHLDSDGSSALIISLKRSWDVADVWKDLITQGADATLRNRKGDTALHAAAEMGNVLAIKVLVQDPCVAPSMVLSAKGSRRMTALELAMHLGQEECSKLLCTAEERACKAITETHTCADIEVNHKNSGQNTAGERLAAAIAGARQRAAMRINQSPPCYYPMQSVCDPYGVAPQDAAYPGTVGMWAPSSNGGPVGTLGSLHSQFQYTAVHYGRHFDYTAAPF
jgi:hypothetical protein